MKLKFKIIATLMWMIPFQGYSSDIVVSINGPITSISEAIEMAEPGSTIRVEAGVYAEHDIEINKPLTLLGINNPVIDGTSTGHILIIRSDDVTVSGFVLKNTGRSHIRDFSAVLVEQSENVNIIDNRLENVFFGIYYAETTGGKISGNNISATERREASSGNGIHLWNSSTTVITKNTIQGMRDGIYLEFITGAEISENRSINNNRYGLHFMFSNECTYRANLFRSNGAGVAVMYSRNVDMTDNIFEHNWGSGAYGLLLKDMNNSNIENNRFYRNTVAIYSEGSNNLMIRRNHIELNGWAVKIQANSRNNMFTENNFIENTFDVGTNSTQNPNTFAGNFWSHYDGYDLDRNGIGDIPYRPVRLFSVIIERQPEALILLRSLLITILDTAERMMPVLTPATLMDETPKMERIQ